MITLERWLALLELVRATRHLQKEERRSLNPATRRERVDFEDLLDATIAGMSVDLRAVAEAIEAEERDDVLVAIAKGGAA